MAVAFRRLADEGFRPRGTLIYLGVADEEAGGEWGGRYMAEHHWDAIGADYVGWPGHHRPCGGLRLGQITRTDSLHHPIERSAIDGPRAKEIDRAIFHWPSAAS